MKVIVVDEHDGIIAHKDREALAPSDIYRVARLLIVNSKGQLLLAQRAFVKKKDPGLWALAVEGTLEEGETYESNIRKEAQEEIGITLGTLTQGATLRMTGKYNHHSQFFLCRLDLNPHKLRLQKDELEVGIAELQQEVAAHPEKFGYRFSFILETALPFLKQTA